MQGMAFLTSVNSDVMMSSFTLTSSNFSLININPAESPPGIKARMMPAKWPRRQRKGTMFVPSFAKASVKAPSLRASARALRTDKPFSMAAFSSSVISVLQLARCVYRLGETARLRCLPNGIPCCYTPVEC